MAKRNGKRRWGNWKDIPAKGMTGGKTPRQEEAREVWEPKEARYGGSTENKGKRSGRESELGREGCGEGKRDQVWGSELTAESESCHRRIPDRIWGSESREQHRDTREDMAAKAEIRKTVFCLEVWQRIRGEMEGFRYLWGEGRPGMDKLWRARETEMKDSIQPPCPANWIRAIYQDCAYLSFLVWEVGIKVSPFLSHKAALMTKWK